MRTSQVDRLCSSAAMTLLFVLAGLIGDVQNCPAIENPAARYCQTLGYRYLPTVDGAGNEKGVCLLPDNTRAEVWEFFRGKVGQQYSYCGRKGWRTETRTRSHPQGFTSQRAVCVGGADGPGGKAAVELDLLDLLQSQEEGFLRHAPRRISPEGVSPSPETERRTLPMVLPAAFDWRDQDRHSYIGPVRDQGACGDCYAFGAAAAAEGAYNIRHRKFDENTIDFSESYLAWCLGTYGPYSAHFSGCDGADYEYAELEALTREGIIEESYFPYSEEDPGACSHQADPAHIFSGWGRISPNDIAGIKNAIMEYGVLDAAISAPADLIFYNGGIYGDAQTDCPDGAMTATNHAVALVGWGHDPGQGDYWILRNSWGAGWGENGYMKIGMHAARVACSATFLRYSPSARPPLPALYLLRRE